MKNRKILSALALLCAVSLCSCGGGSSDSESSAAKDTTAAVTSAAISTADTTADEDTTASAEATAEKTTEAETTGSTVEMIQYKTGDRQFRFEVPDNLKLDKTLHEEDCEYCFTADSMSIIGVSSYGDIHYTAKGFMQEMLPDFESKFTDVSLEETTVNGHPAMKMTASKEAEGTTVDTVYYIVQYGNGELFMLMYSTTPISSYDPEPDVQKIFASVEYRGDELKTETERFSNKAFKCAVDEKLWIKSRDDYNVTVKYNLVDNIDEYTCSVKISAEKIDDINEKADSIYNTWKSHKLTKNITKDNAQILGHDAQHIRRTMTVTEVDAVSEYYIFKDGDTTIAVTLVYAESMEDKFLSDIKPMLDTFELR